MTGTRARAELLLAAALVVVAVAAVVVPLAALGALDQGVRIVVLASLLLPLALGLSAVSAVRRRSDGALDLAVAALAAALVVDAGLCLGALIAGRLPARADRWVLGPAVVAALFAALAFTPTRRRFASALTRALRGSRRRPEDIVRAFGDRASRGVPDAELLRQLTEALHRSMGLQRAEVWVAVAGTLNRVVAVPDRPATSLVIDHAAARALANSGLVGEAWLRLWAPALGEGLSGGELRVTPAPFAGELLGLVVVQRPLGAPRFTDDDDRAVTELGRRLGVVLHNRQLDATLQATLDDLRQANEDLRASRSRLVAAADAERRRLERDLHDGAQQHLVAIAVQARLARDLLQRDPVAAAELLAQLGDAVQQSIDELRDLAHGIYPPLLRDEGLVAALGAAVRRHPGDARLLASPDGSTLGRHAPEVEAAIYFCCLEALQNAAKHAAGAPVTVVLDDEPDGIRFEVRDEGPGFDPGEVRHGLGLRHMADRVGAAGGAVSWESSPRSGTVLRGFVPRPPAHPTPGSDADRVESEGP